MILVTEADSKGKVIKQGTVLNMSERQTLLHHRTANSKRGAGATFHVYQNMVARSGPYFLTHGTED